MGEGSSRRAVLARGVTVTTVLTGLAGCVTNLPDVSSTGTTKQHTSITAEPENGTLKFVNNTDDAVCSLELENVINGNTIEILDLPNTHDKLKPHAMFTYASSDYPQIEDDAVYNVTATTCEGDKSATAQQFSFERGVVWRVNEW